MRTSDAGSIALGLVATCGAVAAAVLVVVVTAGSVGLAQGRAQDAADAAALAAVHAPAGPSVAARRAAETYGAVLLACRCAGAVVEVEVAVPIVAPAARALGLTSAVAEAAAELVALPREHGTAAAAPPAGRRPHAGATGRTLHAHLVVPGAAAAEHHVGPHGTGHPVT